MPKRTVDYHSTLLEDLKDPQEAADYLTAALSESEDMFLVALRDVAEVRQMAKIAAGAGVSRESLYRMLIAGGNPTSRNLFGILRALNIEFGGVRPRSRTARRTTTEGQIPAIRTAQKTRGKRYKASGRQFAALATRIIEPPQGGYFNICCTNTTGLFWESPAGNNSAIPLLGMEVSVQAPTTERLSMPQQPGNRSALLELANHR
jgi:probable addiction module antidote protein